jgi:hypothetical protein
MTIDWAEADISIVLSYQKTIKREITTVTNEYSAEAVD